MIVEPKVIFENNQIMVIDKPSGWITNEAGTTGKTPVLQTWINNNLHFPISASHEFRSGIVHRLDKETSGVLIIAKTKEAFEHLQLQFKERKVRKTYTALAHGKVEPKEGEIYAPVGRLPWNRERFGVLPGGREAQTRYKVIRYYRKGSDEFSLLELYPRTGRTHQIRIHLKHLGHPIVSDEFYAGRKRARADRKWCPRLFLQASGIEIEQPESGKKIKVASDLPEDLDTALGMLKQL